MGNVVSLRSFRNAAGNGEQFKNPPSAELSKAITGTWNCTEGLRETIQALFMRLDDLDTIAGGLSDAQVQQNFRGAIASTRMALLKDASELFETRRLVMGLI
jgi:hypothetical protein